MPIRRPCLNCGNLINDRLARCQPCQKQHNRLHPKPPRPHYQGNYKRRAKQVRDNAYQCWICGEGYREHDPWTADHLIPADPESPLLPAHRTCNSKRGNKPLTP